MKRATSSVSPRQVAAALGVSESSVKRWSDQGLMATRKTAGGHRKLVLADVLRFVHEQGFEIGKPELLGLPGQAPHRPLAPEVSRAHLLTALTGGDRQAVDRIIVGLFTAGMPLTDVFDLVLAPALHELGSLWEHGTVRVFEEHRAIGLVHHALHDLRALLPRAGKRGPGALIATLSGDPYTAGIAMAELTLAELGWQASNLGPDTPAVTVCEAIAASRPRLVALGIQHVGRLDDFVASFATIAACARTHRTAIVVGGAAITAEVRAGIRFAACCASMRELADFSASLAA